MFHANRGKNVSLQFHNLIAKRTGAGHNVVFSAERLKPGSPFRVKAEGSSKLPTTMGVSKLDPKFQSKLPFHTRKLDNSLIVEKSKLYEDGECIGEWEENLKNNDGKDTSVMWDGENVFLDDNYLPVFKNVTGPLWAVVDMGWQVSKISSVNQEPGLVTKQYADPDHEYNYQSQHPKEDEQRRYWKQTPVSFERRDEDLLPYAMGGINMGGLQAQSMDNFVVQRPKRITTINCPYGIVCDRFIDSLNVPDAYFEPRFDQCFCESCVESRGDGMYYRRGNPPTLYSLPHGWCRFGLHVPAIAHGMKVFSKWHVAYHGTVPENIRTIIESGLLITGDYNIQGEQLAPPPGHFTKTYKPVNHDIEQVFFSPTVAYAGARAYAKPQSWIDPQTGNALTIQVALQVRIKPGSYKVGKETLGLGDRNLDDRIPNSELEWSTKLRGATILQGILVKFF